MKKLYYNGLPYLQGDKIFYVTVLDVNDNAPIFTEQPYLKSIPEVRQTDIWIIKKYFCTLGILLFTPTLLGEECVIVWCLYGKRTNPLSLHNNIVVGGRGRRFFILILDIERSHWWDKILTSYLLLYIFAVKNVSVFLSPEHYCRYTAVDYSSRRCWFSSQWSSTIQV